MESGGSCIQGLDIWANCLPGQWKVICFPFELLTDVTFRREWNDSRSRPFAPDQRSNIFGNFCLGTAHCSPLESGAHVLETGFLLYV